MSQRTLVAYETKHGSTAEVANAIADVLREQGLPVDVAKATDVKRVDAYDAVVLGAPRR